MPPTTETQDEPKPDTISEKKKLTIQDELKERWSRDNKRRSTLDKRLAFGRLLLAGQAGLNPCLCFAFCCSGTCTLQHGCALAGLIQVLCGLVESFVYSMQLIFYDSPPLLQYPNGIKNLTNEDQDDIDGLNFSCYAMLLASGILFSLIAGVILCWGASKLSKPLTLLYCGLMLISILFANGVATYCSYLVLLMKFSNVNGTAIKSVLYFRIWSCFFVTTGFRAYFLACSYGLYRQIITGEYMLPQYSRGDSIGGNPIMPTPPVLPKPPAYPGLYSKPPRPYVSDSPPHEDK